MIQVTHLEFKVNGTECAAYYHAKSKAFVVESCDNANYETFQVGKDENDAAYKFLWQMQGTRPDTVETQELSRLLSTLNTK